MSSKSRTRRPPPKPVEAPRSEILEVDDAYQNREIAEKAFYLRTHLHVLWEEVNDFEKMVEKSDAPEEVKTWLNRVHGNTSRYFQPAMNNLDQVRYTLDKEGHGKPKPRGE